MKHYPIKVIKCFQVLHSYHQLPVVNDNKVLSYLLILSIVGSHIFEAGMSLMLGCLEICRL